MSGHTAGHSGLRSGLRSALRASLRPPLRPSGPAVCPDIIFNLAHTSSKKNIQLLSTEVRATQQNPRYSAKNNVAMRAIAPFMTKFKLISSTNFLIDTPYFLLFYQVLFSWSYFLTIFPWTLYFLFFYYFLILFYMHFFPTPHPAPLPFLLKQSIFSVKGGWLIVHPPTKIRSPPNYMLPSC